MPKNSYAPEREPDLQMDDIQGIAVPGFFKPHQTLLCLRIPDDPEVLTGFRSYMSEFEVTSGTEALNDRVNHRKAAQRGLSSPPGPPRVLVAAALAYRLLQRLAPDASAIRSVAFKQGLAARSALLGDPQGVAHPGDPRNWIVGRADHELDAIIVVADDSRDAVDEVACDFEYALCALGVIVHVEKGDASPTKQAHEHFGFNDGISQPGIRGYADPDKPKFITRRYVGKKFRPDTWLQGYPGQDLVWPGEFVFGYPAAGPDPLVPGPIATGGPTWMNNGSYLVFRRLRQDVVSFWTTMDNEARRLSAVGGFGAITAERLASLLIGRWPDGTPVQRSPGQPIPELGRSNLANNNFRYGARTKDMYFEPLDVHPKAEPDPLGRTCPWASHIRKVNPRDAATDMGGAADTLSRRLLRVGVAYGPFLPESARLNRADPASREDRGLLFMSIQSSIENQFEFLHSKWMNDTTRPKTPGGHDMIVGQNPTPGESRERHCLMFGKGSQSSEVRAGADFVVPTGGGYFFVPSLRTLKKIMSTGKPARAAAAKKVPHRTAKR